MSSKFSLKVLNLLEIIIQNHYRYYGSERDKRFDDFISTISFFTGHCFPCKYCGINLNCPSNYSDILYKVISPFLFI